MRDLQGAELQGRAIRIDRSAPRGAGAGNPRGFGGGYDRGGFGVLQRLGSDTLTT